MGIQFSFTYLPCQTCTAKIHCDQCAEQVTASLLQLDGIAGAEVDMMKKYLSVSGTVDPEDLEEHLEDLGVFAM